MVGQEEELIALMIKQSFDFEGELGIRIGIEEVFLDRVEVEELRDYLGVLLALPDDDLPVMH